MAKLEICDLFVQIQWRQLFTFTHMIKIDEIHTLINRIKTRSIHLRLFLFRVDFQIFSFTFIEFKLFQISGLKSSTKHPYIPFKSKSLIVSSGFCWIPAVPNSWTPTRGQKEGTFRSRDSGQELIFLFFFALCCSCILTTTIFLHSLCLSLTSGSISFSLIRSRSVSVSPERVFFFFHFRFFRI